VANSLLTLNPEFWAKEAQKSLFVNNSAMLVANTTLRNLVAGEGDTVRRVIMSHAAQGTYTPGSDLSFTTLSSSEPALSIATWFFSAVRVDDTEKKQSIISIGEIAAQRMMANHNNRIEQAVLYEVFNATFSLDDGNVGGTSGNNIVLNTSNVPQVFTSADTQLDAVDAPRESRIAVVGGHFLAQLRLQQAGRTTRFGDRVNARGEVGELFGWKIIYNNNLPYHAVLDMTTIPTDTDTVTIAGVVFTADASGAAVGAGAFSIGDQAADAITYLVNAINDSGTQGAANFIDIGSEDRFLLRDKRRIVATNQVTSIAIDGFGDVVVSETLTPAASVWSEQRQNALFCTAGSVHQIVQIPPKLEVARDQDQFADIVKSLLGYGVQSFDDGRRQMVDVQLDASTSDWS